MHKHSTIWIVMWFSTLATAQNLVPNPGFETLTVCPDNLSQIARAAPWSQPTIATPDLFNSCSLAATGFCMPTPTVGVPDNCFGSQLARTGDGYAGINLRGNQGNPEYREYVETPLTIPLVGGVTYEVSFWVSLADQSQFAIGSIGAYFSIGSVAPLATTDTLTQFTPQVMNPNPSIIDDRLGWVEVTGFFVATGDENHMLIGNFLDAPTTITLPAPAPVGRAYYYVDDFSVTAMAPIVPPSCILASPAVLPAMDDVLFDVDSTSPNAMQVDATIEFSTDAGMTFQLATMSATSPNPNPAVGLPLGPQSFEWDSRGDGVGLVAIQLVTLRASIDDGTASNTCQDSFNVDNSMLCNGICGDCDLSGTGPTILDALQAAQIAAGLVIPTPEQVTCCDVNSSGAVDVLDALGIAQAAAGLPVALMCT